MGNSDSSAPGTTTNPSLTPLSIPERTAVVHLIRRLLADLQAANSDSSCSTDAFRWQLTVQLRRLAIVLWRDRGPEAECVVASLVKPQAEESLPSRA